MHDVVHRLARNLPTDTGLLTVRLDDPDTWTLGRDRIAGGFLIRTSFCPIRFSPAFGMPGTPHHYQTAVTGLHDGGWVVDEQTYQTEQDARDGHAAFVARYAAMTGQQGAA